MDKQKEMHRHKRQVYCVSCILNQLGDSILESYDLTGGAYDTYGQMAIGLAQAGPEHKSIMVVVGKVYSSMHYLNNNLLSKDSNYEAYLSVARNLIEKLALLNHIINKEKRASSLSSLYDKSSFDILAYIEADPSQYAKLMTDWMSENNWSSSTVESRVSSLGNPEIIVLYAYISRLVHGINRDDMLKRETDMHYISGYICLVLSTEVNRVMAKIPEGVYPKNLKLSHTKAVNSIENPWKKFGGFKAILSLTGFRIHLKESSQMEDDFLKNYNEKLEEVVALGYQFFPKIDYI